jgi:four helix bundle protein
MAMPYNGNDLSDRLLNFAVEVVKLTTCLNKTMVGRHMGKQLMRSGTSAGANYEEACGGESKADFVHKLQIALKELKESFYWLRLIDKSGLLSEKGYDLGFLLNEAQELTRIVAKSIITVKRA